MDTAIVKLQTEVKELKDRVATVEKVARDAALAATAAKEAAAKPQKQDFWKKKES